MPTSPPPKRIAAAINDYIGTPTAEPLDPSTVQLTIPQQFAGKVVALLTEIEQLQIEPDLPAKIVIDERSGIIVMGRDVRVSTVAVAQGNLTVSISEAPQVSQPAPLSRGQTVVVPRTKVGVQEDGKKFALVREGVSLQQLVDGLNALGIGPARHDRDPAGDQGRGRDPGRHRGDVMAALPMGFGPTPALAASKLSPALAAKTASPNISPRSPPGHAAPPKTSRRCFSTRCSARCSPASAKARSAAARRRRPGNHSSPTNTPRTSPRPAASASGTRSTRN
jgi:hypothetical protein